MLKSDVDEALRRDCDAFAGIAAPSETIGAQLAAVEASAAGVEARLAEFSALAAALAADAAESAALVPQLAARAAALDADCAALDALGTLVRGMAAAVGALEERADAVERFLGAHSRRQLLRAIPGLRASRVADPALPEWKPVPVPRAAPVLDEIARLKQAKSPQQS